MSVNEIIQKRGEQQKPLDSGDQQDDGDTEGIDGSCARGAHQFRQDKRSGWPFPYRVGASSQTIQGGMRIVGNTGCEIRVEEGCVLS